jgi:outer membrane autotransporter protein
MGLNAHYGYAQSDITANYDNGSIDSAAYGIGTSMTWYTSSDAYVDVQIMHNRMTSDLSSDSDGSIASGVETTTMNYSVEVGKRLLFAGHSQFGWTPQIQLSYADKKYGEVVDEFDNAISISDEKSYTARLGLLTEFQTYGSYKRDKQTRIYQQLNAYRTVYGDEKTFAIGDSSLTYDMDPKTIGEAILGIRRFWNKGRSGFYADVTYRFDMDNAYHNYVTKGNLGWQTQW